ncbi:hypothetical protein DI09_66p150 [Mitosporidium daphniae]|uniref:Uncharacterized protein n=1 Tax=Mitosporidium daphniae TaxID=1485682 RepID=A0A098VS38_9MICR|nr:uncharacterized protein DI09_66p150 [Mitosporidium daphniae]KGG50551.1 hypothetical protein DI09_66p150 [Mitosporidium daphniae]|eukprot:XP_013236978.1 uncharacterized protein DI09_66p150 [Mitosporidium daphniae]
MTVLLPSIIAYLKKLCLAENLSLDKRESLEESHTVDLESLFTHASLRPEGTGKDVASQKQVDKEMASIHKSKAWMHLKSEDANALSNAEKDCLKALELDPKYTKAQVRLGSVLLAQKKYKSAVDILEKASLADPTNESITSQLAEAKALLSNEHPSSKDAAPNAPGFDLSSLLSDPNLMSMAQNFMSSDAAKGLLNNPNIANLASQFLGSGMKGNGPPK